MAKTKTPINTYEEMGRVRVSPTTEVIVSAVLPEGREVSGIVVNSFIKSQHYTGYTQGTFIPVDKIAEFRQLIP